MRPTKATCGRWSTRLLTLSSCYTTRKRRPLFFFFHVRDKTNKQLVSNVDRLLALYQAAHPDVWMEPSNIGPHGNVYLEDYQEVSGDTALLPFRKTAAEFWSPNACRNTTVLGYAYPETQRWQYPSDQTYQRAATSAISTLYAGRTRLQLTTPGVAATAAATAFGERLADSNNTFTEWTIDTQAMASRLPPTFTVGFSFVGLFQSDPGVDVGSWMVLMPDDDDDGDDVHRSVPLGPQAEEVLHGTTSITSHLIDLVNAGKLDSLDVVDVVPYLRDHLAWNVFTVSWGGGLVSSGRSCKFPISLFFFAANLSCLEGWHAYATAQRGTRRQSEQRQSIHAT